MPNTLRMPPAMMDELTAHLFPGDGDEHAAVIAASVLTTERGTRFLAHRLFLAADGVDYVPGERGYRMLTPTFVMDRILECADLGMAYLAVHCHGGTTSVGFSGDDLASHERGYPALLDIADGPPVGALVFASDAVAADIWWPDGRREQLTELVVPGRPIRRIYDAPPMRPPTVDERYDRQSRLFGDRGQAILGAEKVGVIGAGGVGSLVNEYLARLGVGEIVIVDPDSLEASNVPRVVGSEAADLVPWWTRWLPRRFRSAIPARRTAKVAIARRVAKQANPKITFTPVDKDVTIDDVARWLVDCDYLVLAADSMQARLVFNALVHQYLIPGVQLGAKAQVDDATGSIEDIFSVIRPVVPGQGCLWCNQLINPAGLQDEATAPEQRRRQRYVDDEDVPAPSVITLNAVAAAMGTNDYLMTVTGLLEPSQLEWTKIYPHTQQVAAELPRGASCSQCSASGRLGRGPLMRLPTRP